MSPKNPKIHPITITNPIIEDYCLKHSSILPQELHEIEKFTKENIPVHRMLSNNIQAHFLISISKMLKPQKILEIGTFTGYSTTCLYQGLAKNGRIITIEKKQEFSNIANHFFNKFGYHNIQIITGNALTIIPSIKEKFNLIYLDADKENIFKYYQILLPLLENDGWLLIDNTLWKGLVSEPAKEPVTKIIQEFNDFLNKQKNIFYVLLPIRDGITLIKKS